MTDDRLRRIETAIDHLTARVEAVTARLDRIDGPAPRRCEGPASTRERVISFLDQFRAGEALGELSLGAWIAVCRDPALRGGLRAVQAREGSHARMLAERIKELGGAPRFEIPETTYAQVMAGSASTEKSDAEKVHSFVARFPDPDRALAPIHAIADHLEDDPETQALLRAIAADERATLELFYAARDRLAER